jgi:hypothetical protein
MDNQAINSRNRVRENGRNSKDRLESEVRAVAKKIAHHGPENLVEYIRQRCKASITLEWAESLCVEFGWKKA